MKKRLVFVLLAAALALGGCGGSTYESGKASEASEAYTDDSYYDEDVSEAVEEADSTGASGGIADVSELDSKKESVNAKKISQDKLIYTCDIIIDTLEFEKSTKELSGLIEKYEGFLESESYSDGGSNDYYSYYYISPEDKHDTYTATIRIPSDKYKDFLEQAGGLGDVRSKNSHVDNVSQEYTDLNTSLEVYESAYKRYLDLLERAEDESYALELQAKITETQEKIAQIKTRMNRIDTDVAYSFVNITIKEVSKYEEKPLPKDTFGQRMVSEISDSLEGFLDFLEGVLVVIIHIFPFLILAGIIVAIVFAVRSALKKSPKYQEKKRQKEEKMKQQFAAKTGGENPYAKKTVEKEGKKEVKKQ